MHLIIHELSLCHFLLLIWWQRQTGKKPLAVFIILLPAFSPFFSLYNAATSWYNIIIAALSRFLCRRRTQKLTPHESNTHVTISIYIRAYRNFGFWISRIIVAVIHALRTSSNKSNRKMPVFYLLGNFQTYFSF